MLGSHLELEFEARRMDANANPLVVAMRMEAAELLKEERQRQLAEGGRRFLRRVFSLLPAGLGPVRPLSPAKARISRRPNAEPERG